MRSSLASADRRREVLYVTELIGLILISMGYRAIVADRTPSLHVNQRTVSTTAAPI